MKRMIPGLNRASTLLLTIFRTESFWLASSELTTIGIRRNRDLYPLQSSMSNSPFP